MSYPNRPSERRRPREWIAVVGLIVLTVMVTLFVCETTRGEHITFLHVRTPQ